MLNLLVNKYTIAILATVAVFLAIWSYGVVQYNKGYKNRDLQAQIEFKNLQIEMVEKRDKEVNRQIAANNQAKENSRKQILQIQVEKDQLEKIIEDQENEASKDPNRDRIGLSTPSVMRINKIK